MVTLKNLEALTVEINQAVKPNGGTPKTTGPGLNALLKSLATEVTTLPQLLDSATVEPVVVLAATPAELPNPGRAGVLYALTAVDADADPVLYRWDAAAARYVPLVPAPATPPATTRVRTAFGADAPITFEQDTDFEAAEGGWLTEGFDATGSAAAFSFTGAVRGVVVRVPYHASAPFTLPASFNLLTGPLPTDSQPVILYFRYVRANVVDVTVGTGQPATPPVLDYTTYPLRTLVYDDSDAFCTFEGNWLLAVDPNWPGGCSNGRLLYNRFVTAATPPTQCTSGIFEVTGTPQEGIELYGCSEDDATVRVYLQALAIDAEWHELTPFTTLAYVLRPRPGIIDPRLLGSYDISYGPNGTQSYYSRLQTVVMFTIWGLPAGRYRLRLVKDVNAASESEDANRKLTIVDGFRVYTRRPA